MTVYKDKTPTKDGRSYYFQVYKKDYSGKNKIYKSKKYLTLKEAKEEEAKFILLEKVPASKKFGVVADAFKEFCYKTKKESTAMAYDNAIETQLKPYFKEFSINTINVSNINKWKEEMLKKNYSLNYLNKIHNILSSIFEYAIANYDLDRNVAHIAGRFKIVKDDVVADEDKIRYITYDEFKKFIANVDDELYYAVFNTLFFTGMRKGELQALQMKDVNFKTNEITVNKNLTVKTKQGYKITNTKNAINRKIKMSSSLSNILKEYIDKQKQYTDYSDDWFLFGNSRFLPATSIDRYKHYYFSLVPDIKEITIHEFRHSHVSMLINEYIKSGETDTTKFFLMMSNRMGHTIEVMERTYMHLFPTIQDKVVDLLERM